MLHDDVYPTFRTGNVGVIFVLNSLTKFSLVEPIEGFTPNVLTEHLEKRTFLFYRSALLPKS